MGRQFIKNGEIQPWDGITERQRRLSAPLPDYPMKWLKLDQATAEGYHPFAGFFLPHEYPMMNGFLVDLHRAGREYCGVRDTKHAKGISIFAKNKTDGNENKIITESTEDIKTQEATKVWVAEGVAETGQAERRLREAETNLASGAPTVRSEDRWDHVREAIEPEPPSLTREAGGDVEQDGVVSSYVLDVSPLDSRPPEQS